MKNRNTILTVYSDRYELSQLSHIKEMLNNVHYIIADSREQAIKVVESTDIELERILDIPPFDSRIDVGISQQINTQSIMVPIDGLDQDTFIKLILILNKYSMYVDPDAYAMALDNIDSLQILGLATCTDGATGNRTVLFLIAKGSSDPKPSTPVNPPDDQPKKPTETDYVRPPAKTGDSFSNSPYFWFAIFVGSVMSLLILVTIRRRQL